MQRRTGPPSPSIPSAAGMAVPLASESARHRYQSSRRSRLGAERTRASVEYGFGFDGRQRRHRIGRKPHSHRAGDEDLETLRVGAAYGGVREILAIGVVEAGGGATGLGPRRLKCLLGGFGSPRVHEPARNFMDRSEAIRYELTLEDIERRGGEAVSSRDAGRLAMGIGVGDIGRRGDCFHPGALCIYIVHGLIVFGEDEKGLGGTG